MPKYEYRCMDCEHPFEVRMSMSAYSEGAHPECPSCGSKKNERVFTSVNVSTGSGGACPKGIPSGSSGPGGCGHNSGFT